MAPKQPVLSLSTLAPDRPIIEIDGKKYEVAVTGDLDLVESSKLKALEPSLTAFYSVKGDNHSQKSLEEMSVTFTPFVELIVRDCAKSVTDKLKDSQRMAIINVFTNAAAGNVRKPKPATAKRKRTTTAKT